MQISAFHHLSLTVTDLDASTRWYEQVFGLEALFGEQPEGRRAAVYRFPGVPLSIGFVQHGDGRGTFDPTVVGLDHAAFTVTSREELDDWGRRLDELGIEHSGAIDVPPGAILNFKDPDGIALALFWDRP